MNIRPINIKSESDILALTKIWQKCFTDDLPYINSFINSCLPYITSWFIVLDDKPVSVLSLIPSYALHPKTAIYSGSLSRNQQDTPPSSVVKIHGAYIYGVATLPEYRGNSYSRILLSKAIDYSEELGLDYIVVKPADELLFDLYRKAGFNTTLYGNKRIIQLSGGSFENNSTISDTDLPIRFAFTSVPKFLDKSCTGHFDASSANTSSPSDHPDFAPLSPEQLFILREQSNHETLLWPPEVLRYALIEALSRPAAIAVTDGFLYFITHPSDTDEKIIRLLETNAETPAQFNRIVAHIRKLYPEALAVLIDSANIDKTLREDSALLKILNPDPNIEDLLSAFYLSLPME